MRVRSFIKHRKAVLINRFKFINNNQTKNTISIRRNLDLFMYNKGKVITYNKYYYCFLITFGGGR